MSKKLRVGIVGAGWPGAAHAKGYLAAGGYEIAAVADLIPERRKKLIAETAAPREHATADDLLGDGELDVVSLCVPTHLHADLAVRALKAGRHVLCEPPAGLDVRQARAIAKAAQKSGKCFLVALQRRFGGAEQSSRQAIGKGYAGAVFHARATWMRTRGIPLGSGCWYTDRALAGGGAMTDLGVHLLDLAWVLLGQPAPVTVFAATHARFRSLVPEQAKHDVEDAGFALVRFANGSTLELSASWAMNQPPSQNGSSCRVNGESGAVDVYTPGGAVLWRGFDGKGPPKSTPLPPPKLTGHAAMMRHLRACIDGKAPASPGVADALALHAMLDAIQRSVETGRSVDVKVPG